MCGHVGGSVTVGAGFEVTYAQTTPYTLLLPVDQDIKLSALSPAPYLPAKYHASCHDDITDQTSKTGSHP